MSMALDRTGPPGQAACWSRGALDEHHAVEADRASLTRGQRPDDPPAEVDLVAVEADVGRGGRRMVVVVPAFARS